MSTIDRARAADLGVPVSRIATTLESLFGGRQVTQYKQASRQYDVILQIEDAARLTPSDLGRVYVRSDRGGLVQLSNVVSQKETITPRGIPALQPAALDHHQGPPRARKDHRRRRGLHQQGIAPGHPAGRIQPHMGRRDARICGERERHLPVVRARPALHLPHSRRAVRKLGPPGDHLHRRRARPNRRRDHALRLPLLGRADDQQPVRPVRADPAHRPDRQERHPHRRVRQPAAARGKEPSTPSGKPPRCASARS